MQFLLTRSIALALEAVGFESADPVAVESFRAETEECTAQSSAGLRVYLIDNVRYRSLSSHCPAIHAALPTHPTYTA